MGKFSLEKHPPLAAVTLEEVLSDAEVNNANNIVFSLMKNARLRLRFLFIFYYHILFFLFWQVILD